jgi:hypothetical protein
MFVAERLWLRLCRGAVLLVLVGLHYSGGRGRGALLTGYSSVSVQSFAGGVILIRFRCPVFGVGKRGEICFSPLEYVLWIELS